MTNNQQESQKTTFTPHDFTSEDHTSLYSDSDLDGKMVGDVFFSGKELERTSNEGNYFEGTFIGRGELICEGVYEYEGEFFHSKYHGKGALRVYGEYSYYGKFNFGKKEGFGYLIDEINHASKQGIWENDEFVRGKETHFLRDTDTSEIEEDPLIPEPSNDEEGKIIKSEETEPSKTETSEDDETPKYIEEDLLIPEPSKEKEVKYVTKIIDKTEGVSSTTHYKIIGLVVCFSGGVLMNMNHWLFTLCGLIVIGVGLVIFSKED